jgi:hypothetical protein
MFTLDVVFWHHSIMTSQSEANYLQMRLFLAPRQICHLFLVPRRVCQYCFNTSDVLFLVYFEFYQHSTPVVSSNQILGILEAFNNIQLLTSDEVDLLIYQPRECDIHRGLLDLSSHLLYLFNPKSLTSTTFS